MKKRFNKLAGLLICITFAVFLLFLKDKVDYIWGAVCTFARILTPFVYAFAMAYILNFLYRFLNTKVFGKIKSVWFSKAKKPISLLLTYIIFIGLFAFLIAILVPQLSENISKLIKNAPSYMKTFRLTMGDFLAWVNERFNLDVSVFDSFNKDVTKRLTEFFTVDNFGNISNMLITAGMNTASFFYNWVMAFIISIYMLSSKEFLYTQLKRLGAAFLPTKWMPTIYEIIDVSDDKCGKFLVGKLLDSAIMALLCFICMTILGLPYAPLISVIVAVCNIIPFFGPFIGGIPSALLLFFIDPIHCLKFVIMIVILQQIDGNIIGPKVVGSQVGLIGFWSIFSVMVAGAIFGIPGMILGTPIFAAVYTLVGKKTRSRIEMKGEKAEAVINMDVINTSTLTNIKAKVIKTPKFVKAALSESQPENDEEDEDA